MEAIKETVKNLMQTWEAKKKKSAALGDPEVLFKKALTKKELAHIKFKYFKKGILGVSADSSVWLYQLNLKKEDLLVKLNKRAKMIKDIRLTLGERK